MLKRHLKVHLALLTAGLFASSLSAAGPILQENDAAEAAKKKIDEIQEILSFEVLVVDQKGEPFKGTSDEDGVITVELPASKKTDLWVANKRYQLPAKLGRRTTRIEVERGKSMKLNLVLQPIGLDVLGDWEDLCGLVFG